MPLRRTSHRDTVPTRRQCLLAVPALLALRSSVTLADAPATRPATLPGEPPPLSATERRAAKIEGDRKRIEDYLLKEYAKLLNSPDWVRRSLAVISYARLPVPQAIPVLLDVLNQDKSPVVQMLAFEGLRARAEWISPEQHNVWVAGTLRLAKKGAFRSRLRAGLFDVLATAPMSDRALSQKLLIEAVAATHSQVSDDVLVLDAAGRCLGVWRHEGVADLMVTVVGTPTFESRRAARMLKSAGFPVPADALTRPATPRNTTAATRSSPPPAANTTELAAWWKTEKARWKPPIAVPGELWRKIKPDLLPHVPRSALLDPADGQWLKELELGRPELKNFDVAFMIDVSGSMGPALKWMQREISGIMQAMTILAREPRIGLTFFSGGAFTYKTYPLTGDIKAILATLQAQKLIGGGEELVVDALKDAIAKNPWPKSEGAAKILVLVADEPIVPRQVPLCREVAEDAKAKGYKIFSLSPSRIPPTVADLAKAGGGEAVVMPLPSTTGEARAPGPALDNSGAKLMTGIVSNLLSPAFKDRIAPLVATVLYVNAEVFAEE